MVSNSFKGLPSDFFEKFTRYTGIEVRFCDMMEDFSDLDKHTQYDIEFGKQCGCYDKQSRTIRLYSWKYTSPDNSVNHSRIVGDVLNFSLYHLGWDGIFLDDRKNYLNSWFSQFIELYQLYFADEFIKGRNDDLVGLCESWKKDNRYSQEVAKCLCSLFDFPDSDFVEKKVSFAISHALSDEIRARVNKGDKSVISELIIRSLDPANKIGSVCFGYRPDALMRCGYPKSSVYIKSSILSGMQKESGLDERMFAKVVTDAILSPLAVFEATKPAKDNSYPYFIVLDLKNGKGNRAVLITDNPLSALQKAPTDVPSVVPYSVLWGKPELFAYLFNHDKAKNLMERGVEGSREFVLIEELKKFEAELGAVPYAASAVQPLRINSNILQKYHNSKYFTETFSIREKLLYDKSQIDKKLLEINISEAKNSAISRPGLFEPLTTEQRMVISVESIRKDLTNKQFDKLTALRITTLGEFRNAFPDILHKNFSKSEISTFESILEHNGLSFYTRPKTCSPEIFFSLTWKNKENSIKDDFLVAVQYLNKDAYEGDELPLPVRFDHSSFSGGAAVLLFTKLASRVKQWAWSPVFISTDEMDAMGVAPKQGAIVTHVLDKDRWVSYYNIVDTNLKEVNPERFAEEETYINEGYTPANDNLLRMLSILTEQRDTIPGPKRGPQAFDNIKKLLYGAYGYFERIYFNGLDPNDEHNIGTIEESLLFSTGGNFDAAQKELTIVQVIVDRLQALGIPTYLVSSQDKTISSAKLPAGRKVLGYTRDGSIYLSEDGCTVNTTIHEYTHVWSAALQISNPTLWTRIKEVLMSTPEWTKIKEDESYSYLASDENRIASEVLSKISGNMGASLIASVTKDLPSDYHSVSEALSSFWGETSKYLLEDKTNIKIEDILKLILWDIFSDDIQRHQSASDKTVAAVNIDATESRHSRQDLVDSIPRNGRPFFNEERNENIILSRSVMRYCLMRNEPYIYDCMDNIDLIINNAKELGTLPIAPDEIGTTKAVHVLYCPIHIGDEILSARIIVKEYENKGSIVDGLRFYRLAPHKEKVMIAAKNVKGFSGVHPAITTYEYKIKELIHKSRTLDKALAGISGETQFSIELLHNSVDTKQNKLNMNTPTAYLSEHLSLYSFAELKGAKLRIEALLKVLDSSNVVLFEDLLKIHKEMAREGLVDRFSDVTLEGGTFRARTFDELSLSSIYFGHTNLQDVSDNASDKTYGEIFANYKMRLVTSLKRIDNSLDDAINEAEEELKDIREQRERNPMALTRKKGKNGRTVLFKGFRELRTKYPLDNLNSGRLYPEDLIVSYLTRIGLDSAEALSIATGGTDIVITSNLDEIRSTMARLSAGDIILPFESNARRVLAETLSKNENGQITFSNCLPVLYGNGKAFIGYPQALLRLDMENKGLSIPVVLDNELMEKMGLSIKSAESGFHLLLSNAGNPIKKDVWFLEETDFPELYPDVYSRIASTFTQLNEAAKYDNVLRKRIDTKFMEFKNDIPKTPLQDMLYELAVKSSMGLCTEVSYFPSSEEIKIIKDSEPATLADKLSSGSSQATLYNAIGEVEESIEYDVREHWQDADCNAGMFIDFPKILNEAVSDVNKETDFGLDI